MLPILLVGAGGSRSRINTARILDLSTDLPIVVEFVDTLENVPSRHRRRYIGWARHRGEGADPLLPERLRTKTIELRASYTTH